MPETSTSLLLRVRTVLAGGRRAVLRHRRGLAALCAFVAVLAGVGAVRPAPPATEEVAVLAHDLPAGATLSPDDVRMVAYPPEAVPDAALPRDDVVGRILAAPVGAGEPVTGARLVGPGLAEAAPGLDAVPVRLPDSGAVGLLRVGDRIDLVGADPQSGESGVLAADVPVLALPADDAAGASATGLGGRLVVVGVPPEAVPDLTDGLVRRYVTYTWPSR